MLTALLQLLDAFVLRLLVLLRSSGIIIGRLGGSSAFTVSKGANNGNVFPLGVVAFNASCTLPVATFIVEQYPPALVLCLNGDVVLDLYPFGSPFCNCFTIAVALMTRSKRSGAVVAASTTYIIEAERKYREKYNLPDNELLETMIADEETTTTSAAARK